MSRSLDERKARLLEALRKDPESARRVVAGGFFGLTLAKMAQGARVVVLDATVLRAAEPPATCPTCGNAATNASRDPNGDWTWACKEGCNP